MPATAARLSPVDRLPASRRLDLSIALPLRNQAALSNLLQQIYDPTSTNFHHYLTPEQFAAQFGPKETDYQAIIAYAKSNGLTIAGMHSNRTLLHVNVSVQDAERLFHLNLRVYHHPREARNFFAPDAEPSLDISTPILAIDGLDDFNLPHPMGLNTNFFHQPWDTIPFATGSGPRGNFIGRNFRTAYAPGVTLDGTGQSVGLFELDGYFPGDIAAYENLAGLPSVPLTNVLIDGYNGVPASRNNEVALDIDMAISMAPGLSRVIVYSGFTPNDVLNRMATDDLASQLSCSWGFGKEVDPVREQILQQFAAQGQSFFQASGDFGAGPITPPSDDAYVTSVGGTSLVTSSNGAWVSESAWIQSAGGQSQSFPIPLWQQGINMSTNQGSTTLRNVPDVAALGDAIIWLIANNGDEGSIGGTSASAPLWAGFAALVNQQAAATGQPAIGFANPAIYAIGQSSVYASAFHDITTGANTNSGSPTKFFAVPGYDLCTGWGSPTGSNLINALLAPPDALQITPSAPLVFAGPVGGPFTPVTQSFSLTNRGAASLNWTVNASIPWLEVPPLSGPLTPGGAAAGVTVRTSPSANSLSAGIYSGTILFINLTDGFTQNRQVILRVVAPPMITSQPASQAALAGMTVTFAVGTATNGSLSFQWRQDNGSVLTNLVDGGNISGSGTSTLTVSNVSAVNVGTYSVVVSNVAGSVISSNAVLSIVPSRPVITTQPANQTVLPGQTVTLTAAAAGNQPLLYQWLENGTNLADGGNLTGSATSSLTIKNISPANAGIYSLFVTNALGSTTSAGAMLTVIATTLPGVNVSVLDSFTGGIDGANPNGLMQAANHTFYGTTQNGGANLAGTVFQMTSGGSPLTLYSFTGGADGANPFAALVPGSDGNFYGTTFQGGTNQNGTVFGITPGGALNTLVSFANSNGDLPFAGLVQGTDKNFYGTSYQGGAGGRGTVFKVTTNGALTILYSFTNGLDGSQPYAGLIQAADGNLYGNTFKGGANGDGTVFKVSTNGVFNIVTPFAFATGAFPYGGLVQDLAGNFYGTASGGGASSNGVVFKMTPAGVLTNLYSFTGGADGANPHAGLLQGGDGNFYGTTQNGGPYGVGTMFAMSPDGTVTTLTSFDGFNGANPQSPLLQGADGNIYGTTQNGGANGKGVIFQLAINSAPQIKSQPASQTVFLGANVTFSVAVLGSAPLFYQWQKGNVSLADGGNIFGSTSRVLTLSNVVAGSAGTYSVIVSNALGFTNSLGAVLTITSSPPFIVVQPTNQSLSPGVNTSFTVTAFGNFPLSYQWQRNATNVTDGGNVSGSQTSTLAFSSVTEANAGTYSVIVSNSLNSVTSSNAVLAVTPPSAAGTAFSTLQWFGNTAGGGAAPNGLMLGRDGNLYGTTQFGNAFGSAGLGTIFKCTTNGQFSTILSFTGSAGPPSGALPLDALVQDTNGNFFGTTELGGTNDIGNIFELTADNTFNNLYSFTDGIDGFNPAAALIIASDGNLYGTTATGGTNSAGNIFRISPGGAFTNLYSFTGGVDGNGPSGALLQATDGNFYGLTSSGGKFTNGAVFKMTAAGVLTNIYSFTGGMDGYLPNGALVQGIDGALYGVTQHNTIGKFQFYGTIFKITTGGTLTTLYALNFTDGALPFAGLILSSNGNFFGTTTSGANFSDGAVYMITPGGTLTTLAFFDGFDDGAHPQSALVEGPDGAFYGTTPSGGPFGRGTLFKLSLTNAPQINTQPANLTVFAGTRVTFNVTVFGAPQLFYQWRKNGTNLVDGGNVSGSSARILTLANVSTADATNYSVIVSNSVGTNASTTATLTVLPLPKFQAITVSNTAVLLNWTAVNGHKYQLQSNTRLGSTNWINLGTPITAANGVVNASDTVGTNSQKFYRVLVTQ